MKKKDRRTVQAVYDASARCGEHLAHLEPGVQGATLALLLATWLAGHEPDVRAELIEQHTKEALSWVPILLGIAGDPHNEELPE